MTTTEVQLGVTQETTPSPHPLDELAGQIGAHSRSSIIDELQHADEEVQRFADIREDISKSSVDDLLQIDPSESLRINMEVLQAANNPEVKQFLSQMASERGGKTDKVTWTHSIQVGGIANAIGYRLGLDEAERARLTKSALLHDIGKISDKNSQMRRAMNSIGKPSEEQRGILEAHPTIGYERYLDSGGNPVSLSAKAILHHHGLKKSNPYPDNSKEVLTEDEIREIEIISEADIIHSLATRDYGVDRPKRTPAEIYAILIREADISETTRAAVRDLLGLAGDEETVRPEVMNRDRTAAEAGRIAVAA